MHQVARALPEHDAYFTPYYGDEYVTWLRWSKLIEFTIGGFRHREACLDYCRENQLRVDLDGQVGGYDMVVMSCDMVVPRNLRPYPIVVVQEGILDPYSWPMEVVKRWPTKLPRFAAGTASMGLSMTYEAFCVASDGYRRYFIEQGARPDGVVTTGIPNFDHCASYQDNDFPHKNYVLACTSDLKETFKKDTRPALIRKCLEIAAGRQLIFKLHPNEDPAERTAEIEAIAPGALVYSSGSAEEMVANCDVLITEYSSLVFVGLALGKEVYSENDIRFLREVVPIQNNAAAKNIADVCRRVLAGNPKNGHERTAEAEEVIRFTPWQLLGGFK